MAAAAVVEKVKKLIALTSSSYIEEARTSAYLACKLIRENGLLVLPQLPPSPPPPPSPPRWHEAEPGWRYIKAKFDSQCRECRGVVLEGARVMWKKGEGVAHVECFGGWA